MPTPQTYEVTAPDGRVFDVEGEGGPPTEQELEQIFRALPKAAATASTAVEKGRGGAYEALSDIGMGAMAGAASTVHHGGDLLRRWLGMERTIDRPENVAAMTPPASLAGKTGYVLEQGAEFLAPMAGVAKAAKALPTLARWGLEGAAGAGVAGVQSGGEPGPMALAAVAPPIGAGIGKVAKGVVGLAQRAAAGAAEGGVGGAMAGAIRTAVPPSSVSMMVQGLKPGNAKLGFPKAVETAMGMNLPRYLGKPIEGVEDLIQATSAAKRDVWAQWEATAGPARAMGATLDGDKIAEAIVKSIPMRTQRTNPAAAKAVRDLADTYRGPLKLQDAEQLLKETNAELTAYYNKFPAARRAAENANPEIAHQVAEAAELRDGINRLLDAPGEGAAARELKRRYGALREVEDVAQRRSMVAARQQPESLSEQIGKVRAAADMARGMYKISPIGMTGLKVPDVSGAADIAAAHAGRAMSTYLKEQQTTNALIRRAFAGHSGRLAPVPAVAQPTIRGLLGPGATRLGPGVDPSDLPGITVRGEYGAKWTPPPPESPEYIAALPSAFKRPDATVGQLFADVYQDAKAQGFKGSPSEIRRLFDDAVKDARDYAAESAQHSPEGFLRTVAKLGGLKADKGMPGEIRALRGAGAKLSDRAMVGAMRTGSVGGVGRVLHSGGKSLDHMAESLREAGYQDIAGPNEVWTAIREAAAAIEKGSKPPNLADALRAVGVRPGTKWWEAADEAFDVAALETKKVN